VHEHEHRNWTTYLTQPRRFMEPSAGVGLRPSAGGYPLSRTGDAGAGERSGQQRRLAHSARHEHVDGCAHPMLKTSPSLSSCTQRSACCACTFCQCPDIGLRLPVERVVPCHLLSWALPPSTRSRCAAAPGTGWRGHAAGHGSGVGPRERRPCPAGTKFTPITTGCAPSVLVCAVSIRAASARNCALRSSTVNPPHTP
jgi:hypothetical protein